MRLEDLSDDYGGHPGRAFRWVMVGLVILIVLLFVVPLIFYVIQPMPGFAYPFYRPFFFPFGLFFGIFALFIIFGVLRWIFWPWGWGYRRRYWRCRDESYYILRARYAKGEITKEQYEQMMQDLQKHPNP